MVTWLEIAFLKEEGVIGCGVQGELWSQEEGETVQGKVQEVLEPRTRIKAEFRLKKWKDLGGIQVLC